MSRRLTVWLLQTGEPLPGDSGNPRPMRAMNLSRVLVEAGHNVVLWSSSFYHQEKRHRNAPAGPFNADGVEVRLLASPGYRRNIGPGRLWDHAMLARNLAAELRRPVGLPDVAFVGYPPIETAAVMTRWLHRRGIPCLLDVKDQWPTIFTDRLPSPLRPLGRVALAPYFYYGRRAMREATALSAMAGGFLQWAAEFAGRPTHAMDLVAPLTVPVGKSSPAERAQADAWWDRQAVMADGRVRVMFVGSHSDAFDMESVAAAAQTLQRAGPDAEFVVCGDGEQNAAWRARMQDLPNVRFPGWVDRARIESLAQRSMAALAPYRNSSDFVRSVPNKVIDALALGLPVLSPLQGEVRQLIDECGVGMAYGAGSADSLAQCVQKLGERQDLRSAMGSRARALYAERFAFEQVYGALVARLEQLAGSRRRT